MMNGTIIGNRYEIVETIGKGGMAIVYKAKCLVLNRYVALKVLRPEFREDKEFINRFKVEAQSAGRLSHPNIVSIYDVCQEDELDYIVMEHVEGVTLKQYLEAKGTIPWREAVDYAAQICAGLDHAHRNGIIHKDIKPHNIMITREGTLKITDFGIAKVMSSSTISTGNAANMGSVHYFSPEQARGGYTDHKTDIYSLGVVLYEMVTGKLPFQGDTAIAIAMQHIEKTPEAPTELNPDVPKSLENVIFRAMCKEQNLRYDSVTQMLVDLKKVYTGNMVDYSDLASGATTITPIISDGAKDLPEELLGKKRKKKVNKKDLIGVIAGSLTGLVLVVLLFLFGFNLAGGGGGKAELELPDFTNKTVTEAEAMVVNSNLQIVVEKEEKSETVSSGKIISQEPKAGEKVKEDATIKVVVSAGGTEFPMPDLVNRHESDAQNILKDKNLRYSMVPEPSDTIPKDYVVRQEPEANTYIDAANTVVIYVSAGKEDSTVEVPNLLGLTEEEAKAELLDAGLTWGRIEEMESTKAKGTVISQSIRAKVEVKEQTSIDLRISSGKKDAEATKTPKPSNQPATSPTTPPIVIAPPNAG